MITGTTNHCGVISTELRGEAPALASCERQRLLEVLPCIVSCYTSTTAIVHNHSAGDRPLQAIAPLSLKTSLPHPFTGVAVILFQFCTGRSTAVFNPLKT